MTLRQRAHWRSVGILVVTVAVVVVLGVMFAYYQGRIEAMHRDDVEQDAQIVQLNRELEQSRRDGVAPMVLVFTDQSGHRWQCELHPSTQGLPPAYQCKGP